ncbi:unnamed protein product [Clonostachys rosea f. rosea IK726]|uniref:Uncharacterized protein n=1 Tax=Clonostachys rosea f. rosea IK726 TaxID=1349383 RepID=A0ACA9U4J9_BIOOC|nr:unnamed protein product [Clonostachys rosea f. rosea IK726]
MQRPFLATFTAALHPYTTARISDKGSVTKTPLQFKYPGVDINLRDHPGQDENHYPVGCHPNVGGIESPILPMREVGMMLLMDKLTDKPEWFKKVFDDTIVEKWRRESQTQSEDGLFATIMRDKMDAPVPQPKRIISEAAFDFCIAELRSKAKYYVQSKLIPTLDSSFNTVVKSDELVSKALHQDMHASFQQLLADQAACPDWHPNSNDKVQDLVHPSMYPFVYGRSRFIHDEVVGIHNAMEFIGQGQIVPKNTDRATLEGVPNNELYLYSPGGLEINPEYWSNTYQWLPANVAFKDNGRPEFTSYINGLRPDKYPDIYKTIERLLDVVIPAWDQCLTEISGNDRHSSGRRSSRFERISEASDENDSLWSPFDVEFWKASDFRLPLDSLVELNKEEKLDKEGECLTREEMDEEQRLYEQGLPPRVAYVDPEKLAREKWRQCRDAVLPEPKSFTEIEYAPRQNLREKFRESGLQVIVKMASIELTPDKPDFPAGGWHIEGQMNERICATALYYVDCENVTSSHLSFCMATDSYLDNSINYEASAFNWLERVYGTGLHCGDAESAANIQQYGIVETRQGRVLAFPNDFQHAVSSFSLQDKAKPGHRRFIALWLVDPHQRIISTSNVPPQQKEWWLQHQDQRNTPVTSQAIPENLMTVEEANEHRLKLMEVRTRVDQISEFGVPGYSFCEH